MQSKRCFCTFIAESVNLLCAHLPAWFVTSQIVSKQILIQYSISIEYDITNYPYRYSALRCHWGVLLFDHITHHARLSLSVLSSLTLRIFSSLHLHLHYILIEALFKVIYTVWTGSVSSSRTLWQGAWTVTHLLIIIVQCSLVKLSYRHLQ